MTLLLAVCSGAWAQVSFNFVKDNALNFTPGQAITSVSGLTITPSANTDETDNGKWATNSTVTFKYNEKDITLGKVKYKTAPTVSNKIPSAGAYVKIEASENGTVDLLYYINSSSSKTMTISKVSGTTATEIKTESSSKVAKVLSFDVESGSTYYAYVQSNACEYAAIYFTSLASSPTITADDAASITATTSDVEATQDITVTGKNLTGSTLTATLSPAVDGLSVTLDETDISDGAISATATLHYKRTANVKQGTTTLILSDGTTSKNITVTYYAKVVDWTLQSISESTTWTFDDTNIPSGSLNQNISAIYANIDGMAFGSDFDATALELGNATWPYYSAGKFAQAKSFKFNTTVAGTVKVTYNKPGSDAVYISVNGGDNGSASSTTTTEAIAVSAGDVTIKGYSDAEHGTEALLNVSKIEFVKSVAVTGVELNKTSTSIEVGSNETLTATIAPADATNKNVTWTSSNTDVATVDGGVVTGVAEGTATITVTTVDGNFTATCTVTVTAAASVDLAAAPTLKLHDKGANLIVDEKDANHYTLDATKTGEIKLRVVAQAYTYVRYTTDGTEPTLTKGNEINNATGTSTKESSNISITDYHKNYTIRTIAWNKDKEEASANEVVFTITGSQAIAATKELSTFCSEYNLDFSNVENLEAYVISSLGNGTATATKVEKVAAGTGLLLKKTADIGTAKNYVVPLATTVDDIERNYMKGVTEDKDMTSVAEAYILKDGVFQPCSGGTLAAGKAYLDASGTDVKARSFTLMFDDEEATGINAVESRQMTIGNVYNLAGQRVAQPTKGLYIVNGKKVVIK